MPDKFNWKDSIIAFNEKEKRKPVKDSSNPENYNGKTEKQLAYFIERVKQGKIKQDYEELLYKLGWLINIIPKFNWEDSIRL